jgi:hypothetical protein
VSFEVMDCGQKIRIDETEKGQAVVEGSRLQAWPLPKIVGPKLDHTLQV